MGSDFLLLTTVVPAFIAYHLLSGKTTAQNALLVCVSLGVYGYMNLMYPIILVGVAAFAFFTARRIDRAVDLKQREGLMAMGTTFVGGSLLSLQYAGFKWTQGLQPVNTLSGFHVVQWLAPIGMAFYTLGLIGYLVEVKRGRISAEYGFLTFLAAVSFLPNLFLGPVPKHAHLLRQFRSPRSLQREAVIPAIVSILWGCVKAFLITTALAPAIADVFANYNAIAASGLFLGAVLLAVQIYAVFSGYASISNGISILLGIRQEIDFQSPILAVTPASFWRRWYISVHDWLQDYVFIPLGGRSGSYGKWALASVGAFAFAAVWYGTGWSFMFWALSNALLLLTFASAKRFFAGSVSKESPVFPVIRFAAWVVTFFATALTFVWFKALTPAAAISFYGQLFSEDILSPLPLHLAQTALWCVPFFGLELLISSRIPAAPKSEPAPAIANI